MTSQSGCVVCGKGGEHSAELPPIEPRPPTCVAAARFARAACAQHEGAHAVAGAVLGIPPVRASLASAGFVEFASSAATAVAREIVDLAGHAGERAGGWRFDELPAAFVSAVASAALEPAPLGPCDLCRAGRSIAARLGPNATAETLVDELRAQEARALDFVRQPAVAKAIRDIRHRLLAAGTVDGAEIRAIAAQYGLLTEKTE